MAKYLPLKTAHWPSRNKYGIFNFLIIFIIRNVGEDKINEILEKLIELCPNDIATLDQKAKEIASYLIIKEVFGEKKFILYLIKIFIKIYC